VRWLARVLRLLRFALRQEESGDTTDDDDEEDDDADDPPRAEAIRIFARIRCNKNSNAFFIFCIKVAVSAVSVRVSRAVDQVLEFFWAPGWFSGS
jgi:hypothetical protein